jgi:hypothetical protein
MSSLYGKEKPEGLENMGTAWHEQEIQGLLDEIKRDLSINDIAKAHKRTNGGIRSRLRIIAYDKYKASMPINDIVTLTRLSKDDIIDTINRREYAEQKKGDKSKTQETLLIARESDVLSKNLKPKSELSELHEILKTLKSLEVRVAEYIKERSIFDE